MPKKLDAFFVAFGSRNSEPRPAQLLLRDRVTRSIAQLTPEEQTMLQRIYEVCVQCIDEEPEYGTPEWVKWDNAQCTHTDP